MLTHDFNEDGLMDALLAGNDFGNNVFWGRYDAFNGLLLINEGGGNFSPVPYQKSGFYVPGNTKALVMLPFKDDRSLVVASQNQDSLKVFEVEHKFKAIPVDHQIARAEVIKNGVKKVFEFYYGSSFLSQSTRKLYIPEDSDSIIWYDYAGNVMH